MTRVLIIGTGDMGERFAAGLAASGRVDELVVADPSPTIGDVSTTISATADCRVRAVRLDARIQRDVEALLGETTPDLVVQAACLQSPWALVGRTDAAAVAFAEAGLGARVALQLPCLLSVMRAARAVGFTGPIANISLPDLTGPILACVNLAPTVGLGNVAMHLMRVRATLRERQPEQTLPLVRVVGHHAQVYGVMRAARPAEPDEGPRVYLGESGSRADHLAYAAPALAAGIRYNHVTAAGALPVLLALLPGAEPLRWSTPSPAGLPGGYPVRIEGGRVTLDLPAGCDEGETIAWCDRQKAGDGVERIDPEGTVHLTAAAREALAPIAPELADPLPIDDAAIAARAERILSALRS